MKKLNNKKVGWIIREKQKGTKNKTIALIQKISARRIRQIYSQYKKTKQIPKLKKCGKHKSESLTEEQRNFILQEHEKTRLGALYLEKYIERKHKIHVPHNRIHMTLLEKGFSKAEPNKRKQRKWVRYEREHSLSLVHIDWFEYNGKHIIAHLDDASRRILACDEFDNETTENAIIVLDKAIRFAKSYGGILQLITDHGTQFTANKKDKNGEADHRFEEYVKSKGIELIHSRVKHPQTNGKIEKWFDLFNKKRHLFGSLKEFIDWYNEIKPHRSLDFERAETPSEAFRRKIRTEVILGQAAKLFGW